MLRERAATSCGDVAYFTAYAVGLPTADALSRRRRPRGAVPFPVGVQRGRRLALCGLRKQTPGHVGSSTLMLRDFPDLEPSHVLASCHELAFRCVEFPIAPWVIANLRGSRSGTKTQRIQGSRMTRRDEIGKRDCDRAGVPAARCDGVWCRAATAQRRLVQRLVPMQGSAREGEKGER